MGRCTRDQYEKLIREDRDWLAKQPSTLESRHIDLILEQSPDREYGPEPRGPTDAELFEVAEAIKSPSPTTTAADWLPEAAAAWHVVTRQLRGDPPVSKEDKAEFAAAVRSANAITDEAPPKHCGHCEGTRALCTCVCTICHTALHAELDVVELRGALQKANYDYWAVTHPTLGVASNPYKEGIVIVDDPKEDAGHDARARITAFLDDQRKARGEPPRAIKLGDDDAVMEATGSLDTVTARIINVLSDHGVHANAELVNDVLTAVLDTPIYYDFARAVVQEAAHQEKRWGVQHDAAKSDSDWFWLFGHLIGKIVHRSDNTREKKLHRIITIGAVAANWHAHELGKVHK